MSGQTTGSRPDLKADLCSRCIGTSCAFYGQVFESDVGFFAMAGRILNRQPAKVLPLAKV